MRLERTVSWSQTRRDTNFAIPGYSFFCHDTMARGKNKDFSVCGQSCGQSRFCAVFGNRGKSSKRRCRKALRRFALPCPGYRHGTPKPMSKPSGSPVAPSLALSDTPAVPLWNSFALFASDTAFVFWDLCGMKFCILKVLPTGFTPSSDGSIAENNSEIAPHKQRNKRDDKETAG